MSESNTCKQCGTDIPSTRETCPECAEDWKTDLKITLALIGLSLFLFVFLFVKQGYLFLLLIYEFLTPFGS